MAEGAATAPAAGGGGDESATDGGKRTYFAAAGLLSWKSAGLLSRRFEFKPWLDQHSGSLNNWEESAAFVMTSAFLVFMDNDEILQVLSHSTFTSLVLVRHKRTHATVQKEWGM